MTKTCPHCQLTKELTDFDKSSSHKQGVQSWCRVCTKTLAKRWYSENKERVAQKHQDNYAKLEKTGCCRQQCGRKALPKKTLCQICAEKHVWRRVKKTYGLTRQEWEDLLVNQSGVCGLCKEPGVIPGVGQPITSETFVVDHNHKTDVVRGIIHSRCNIGIGYLRDDLATLKLAVCYLEAAANPL